MAMVPNGLSELQVPSPIVANTIDDADCIPSLRRCNSAPVFGQVCTPTPLEEAASPLSCEPEADTAPQSCDINVSDSYSQTGTYAPCFTTPFNVKETAPYFTTSYDVKGTAPCFATPFDVKDSIVTYVPLPLENFLMMGYYSWWLPVSQGIDDRTTVMFRNLPNGFTRKMLEALLLDEGFGKFFDFIYMPANLATARGFGYAFINMVTHEDALRFIEHFQGFDRWLEAEVQGSEGEGEQRSEAGAKRAAVHLSEGLQGLQAHIERYKNSPVMHHLVSDDLRPVIYDQGIRVPFPEPTAEIKLPRLRNATKKLFPPDDASCPDSEI